MRKRKEGDCLVMETREDDTRILHKNRKFLCNTNEQIVKGYLAPDVVLSIIAINSKNYKESYKLLTQHKMKCVLSDFALYEALSSLDYVIDDVSLENLMELLNVCEWMKTGIVFKEMKGERIEHLRKIAKLPL